MSIPILKLNASINSNTSQVPGTPRNLMKCKSPEIKRSMQESSRIFEKELERVVIEQSLITYLYLPVAEVEKGIKITLSCNSVLTEFKITIDRCEVERNCVRQCFSNRVETAGKKYFAIALLGFYNRPFQTVVQSYAGKIKPSLVSVACPEEDRDSIVELEPYKLLEESYNIRKRRIDGPRKNLMKMLLSRPAERNNQDSGSFEEIPELRRSAKSSFANPVPAKDQSFIRQQSELSLKPLSLVKSFDNIRVDFA